MKRFLVLHILTLFVLAASAQRHVVNVTRSNGEKVRIDTQITEEISIPSGAEDISAKMKNGTVISWEKAGGQAMTFDMLPPRAVHYATSVENEPVHNYITNTVYDPDDYEYSLVLNYADHSKALDEPTPFVIKVNGNPLTAGEFAIISKDETFTTTRRLTPADGVFTMWNATPGDTLYYRVMNADGTAVIQEGTLIASGQVRMIYAPSVNNIRDMGGWPVEGGGHMRYGVLYRGAKLHDATNNYLSKEDSIRLRELNIKCEFDLRGSTEAGGGNTANNYSRLGKDVDYRIVPHGMYAYVSAVASYPQYFRYGWNQIREHVLNGDPTFLHCSHGCDRMGTWAMVIDGLMGVSENNLNLDYELSAFAPRSGLWRYRNMQQTIPDYDFGATIGYIKSLPGETLRDKFEYFVVEKCRIPKADVDAMREVLIVR